MHHNIKTKIIYIISLFPIQQAQFGNKCKNQLIFILTNSMLYTSSPDNLRKILCLNKTGKKLQSLSQSSNQCVHELSLHPNVHWFKHKRKVYFYSRHVNDKFSAHALIVYEERRQKTLLVHNSVGYIMLQIH